MDLDTLSLPRDLFSAIGCKLPGNELPGILDAQIYKLNCFQVCCNELIKESSKIQQRDIIKIAKENSNLFEYFLCIKN